MGTSYWKSILSSESASSSKRLVTLIMAGHLILTSLLVSFFTFYLILYVPKGSVNPVLIDLLKVILGYDFYVVLAGLTFITQERFGEFWVQRARMNAEASIKTGMPPASTVNVDTVNVAPSDDEEGGKTDSKRQ